MKTDSILTKREAQVAELCVKGYIGKEIADKLNTSYRTVVNHFQNIYDKTGIRRSTNALVSWWFCVNFSIDISETAKQIIAGVFFLMVLPHEIFIHDTQRRFSRNGRVIELVEKDYEPKLKALRRIIVPLLHLYPNYRTFSISQIGRSQSVYNHSLWTILKSSPRCFVYLCMSF